MHKESLLKMRTPGTLLALSKRDKTITRNHSSRFGLLTLRSKISEVRGN